VTATPLLQASQPHRQRRREPQLVGDLRDERGARVRDQTRSVRRDFYGYRASITHHLQGEPPSSGSKTFDKPKDPRSVRRFRAPARRGRGRYCTLRASGQITIEPHQITCRLNSRTYSPIMRSAQLPPIEIPWWGARHLRFQLA